MHLTRGGSVEAYAPRAGLALYGVGVKALAIIVVDYINALTGNDAGRVHKLLVDGDASYIVETCLCHGDAVYLRLQYFYLHDGNGERAVIGLELHAFGALVDHIVDEPHIAAIYGDAAGHIVGIGPGIHGLHCAAVDHCEILHRHKR